MTGKDSPHAEDRLVRCLTAALVAIQAGRPDPAVTLLAAEVAAATPETVSSVLTLLHRMLSCE